MARLVVFLLLAVFLVGCGFKSASESAREFTVGRDDSVQGYLYSDSGEPAAESQPADDSQYISTVAEEDLADAAELERKIIYTAEVHVVVEDFDGIDEKIMELIQQSGGYLASVSIQSTSGRSRRGTWVARIPTDRYDQFLEDMSDLGVPESVQQHTEDVTTRFIDIEARLETKRELEARIRQLVEEREGKIDDVLQAERELARIRGEIESMEGELRYLTNQTALSTVTIEVREERDYQPPQAPSFGGRVAQTWFTSLTNLRSAGQMLVLAGVAVAPWLPVAAVVIVLVAFLWRSRRRRRTV